MEHVGRKNSFSGVSRRRFLRAGAATGSASLAAWMLACNRARTGTAKPAPVSSNAPVAAGVDPEKLIPEGIKKYYPQIYQYHWSRMTFSKNRSQVRRRVSHADNRRRPELGSDRPGRHQCVPDATLFQPSGQGRYVLVVSIRQQAQFLQAVLTGDLADKFEQPDPLTYTFHFPAASSSITSSRQTAMN